MNVAEILHKPIEWHAERAKCIGGSDATRIMKGEIYELWLEKTGRKLPDDLSDNLLVQLGTFTEPFNRYWFEKTTGLIVDPPCRIVHPEYEFLAANLDGMCNGLPWEAKHVNGFTKEDDVVARYYAQIQHQMMVAQSSQAILSVIFGNHKFQTFTVDVDLEYQQILVGQLMKFWKCVETDTPPEGFEAITVAPSFQEMITVDMTGNNEFASFAGVWLENKPAAKLFENAGKNLRGLMPPEANAAIGYGVKITRSKDNKLYVKEG